MSPRLVAIFAGLLVVVSALVYFLFFTGDTEQPLGERVKTQIDRVAGNEPEVPQAGPVLPTFDIVRVDASGTAVIAGRGVPGASISLLANGKEIASGKINRGGEWALYVDTPLDAGAQELSLKMTLPNGEERLSKQVVVIAVPERPGERPLVVLGEPGKASKILQNPNNDSGLALSVDVIDYDDDGSVLLSGHASEGAILRAYLDNNFIGETIAAENGAWTIEPADAINPGRYRLRVDQLAKDGTVIARIEVPFERADPSAVMRAMSKGGGRVVVQPGNSLWRIARRVYGSGFEYTIIYDANRSDIRDPNLIYPGQIFDLPEKEVIDDELHLLQ